MKELLLQNIIFSWGYIILVTFVLLKLLWSTIDRILTIIEYIKIEKKEDGSITAYTAIPKGQEIPAIRE